METTKESQTRTLDFHRACDIFEKELATGSRPSIETFLLKVQPQERAKLLEELVTLEIEVRLRQGERPQATEYQERFTGFPEAVASAFAHVASRRSDLDTDGAVSLTLTVKEGPAKGLTHTVIGQDILLVGRSDKNPMQLVDEKIAPSHFLIEAKPPQFRLHDLNSETGTFVNGQRAQPMVDLRDGDQIRAGATVLLVTIPVYAAMDWQDEPVAPVQTRIPGRAPEPGGAGPDKRPPDGPNSSNDPYRTNSAPPPSRTPNVPETLVTPHTPPAIHFASVPLALKEAPRIPGYRITREIGHGGMGIVYESVRDQDNVKVAIKTITPAVVPGRRDIDRFKRESSILCQLDHINVVRFLDAGHADGRLFLVMEFVRGIDAAKQLKELGTMSVRRAVRITCHLLTALAYAHEKGFVHRDVKPSNLLITAADGKLLVKLADFGLARVYQESRISGLSMDGDVAGTLQFAAPEQITNFRNVKPAADQFSAAATLFNFLTGVFWCPELNRPKHDWSAVLNGVPTLIRELKPDTPKELEQIICRGLAKDPKARFPDVRAFRQVLRPFAG